MTMPRRRFLASAGAAVAAAGIAPAGVPAAASSRTPAPTGPARVAVSFDLEMSRNFPTWDETRWDYEKGNLDEDTKRYSLEAARRLKAHGGVLHFFAVGRVFEQEKVDWLEEIVKAGHPIGNHTYDHVNVKAVKPDDIQFRFARCPWLIQGKKPAEVIEENIRMTSLAMKTRLGIDPAGFRTPGGFPNGLDDRPDVQAMLLKLGFKWASSKYPAHPLGTPGEEPSASVIEEIASAQAAAQPFRHASGLVEVPMSPPSDITAFRGGRWKLNSFLRAVRRSLDWVIERGAAFDFLGHPSCLLVMDPEFKTVDMICETVKAAGSRAELVDLTRIAGDASS